MQPGPWSTQARRIYERAGYVKVHAESRVELVRVTLSSLIERLDPAVFARIHRSDNRVVLLHRRRDQVHIGLDAGGDRVVGV